MNSIYLYKGQFVQQEEVSISPDDRGYYFGDGIYEVIRIYKGKLFEAEAHYDRFIRTATEVKMQVPDIVELHGQLIELIHRNEIVDGSLYIQMTRGTGARAHNLHADSEPVIMAYCTEAARPVAKMDKGIAAATVEDIRWLRCDLKTLNLLGNVLLKQQAVDSGADECILHRQGTVTECSSSNVFIVRDGRVVTHPANHLVLHGITRKVVLELAAKVEVQAEERPFTLSELYEADEVFLTSTIQEIVPIVTVDKKPVGTGEPGPVTRKLQKEFEQLLG